jgi:hypothetical protein
MPALIAGGSAGHASIRDAKAGSSGGVGVVAERIGWTGSPEPGVASVDAGPGVASVPVASVGWAGIDPPGPRGGPSGADVHPDSLCLPDAPSPAFGASLLPELLPPESETIDFPEGSRGSSDPIGVTCPRSTGSHRTPEPLLEWIPRTRGIRAMAGHRSDSHNSGMRRTSRATSP